MTYQIVAWMNRFRDTGALLNLAKTAGAALDPYFAGVPSSISDIWNYLWAYRADIVSANRRDIGYDNQAGRAALRHMKAGSSLDWNLVRQVSGSVLDRLPAWLAVRQRRYTLSDPG
ncbi:hypothetical protein [Fodinicola acaciae]|uniref:hypothetical protein n=1 Tax=Fodinicola acaciae TaxID=2681555 RepID=UPI0013D029CB|nr:hypothetical protein [Fodinicola acaciae]